MSDIQSVSVIMPSYLGKYANAASGRPEKLLRAIKSFLSQTFEGEKELIIVSDGCEDTNAVYKTFYSKKHEIKLISLNKQPLFSGAVRQAGLDVAQKNIIAYLDSDDYLQPGHLAVVVNQLITMQADWVYYNDFIRVNKRSSIVRTVTLAHGSVGTSSVAHKKSLPVSWAGLNGYGHDWAFVQKLMKASNNYSRIFGCGYVVCHTVGGVDN